MYFHTQVAMLARVVLFSQLELIFYANKNLNCGNVPFIPPHGIRGQTTKNSSRSSSNTKQIENEKKRPTKANRIICVKSEMQVLTLSIHLAAISNEFYALFLFRLSRARARAPTHSP